LEDTGVDGRLIFDGSPGFGLEWDTDWIELAHDKGRWLELVNAVKNLQVP